MLRTAFTVTEDRNRNGQPHEFFRWPVELRQRVIRTVHDANLRRFVMAQLDDSNGLSVQHCATMVYRLQRSLHMWLVRAGLGEFGTSWGKFGPSDRPSIRAAIRLIDPIVDALNGEQAERRAA